MVTTLELLKSEYCQNCGGLTYDYVKANSKKYPKNNVEWVCNECYAEYESESGEIGW